MQVTIHMQEARRINSRLGSDAAACCQVVNAQFFQERRAAGPEDDDIWIVLERCVVVLKRVTLNSGGTTRNAVM